MTKEIQQLKNYVSRLKDFEITDPYLPYTNMAATIVDSILQAGINYDNVVLPRVTHIIETRKDLKRTSNFLKAIKEGKLPEIINWTHQEKLDRIWLLTMMLASEKVETEKDLLKWIKLPNNKDYLKKLKGIGDKTADYLYMLSGGQSAAIDRHLINFLKKAKIKISIAEYDRAHKIISSTAKEMKIKLSVFDHSIWRYMAGR